MADSDWAAEMAAVGKGDKRAFRRVVEAFHPRLIGLARRLLGAGGEADDVVQDSFLKIWERPDRFDPARGSLGAFLARTTANACIDRLRAVRPVVGDEALDALADDRPSAFDRAARQQEGARLQAAIEQLPTRQRVALTLFYDDELSMADVAVLMKCEIKAVESLLSRGRAGLRTILLERKEAVRA